MDGRRRTASGFLLLLYLAAFTAQARPLRTVDELSCAEARAEVARTGSYYVRTPDGPIPITFIMPLNRFAPCPPREHLQYIRVATRDSAACHVGYTCGAN